MYKYKVSKKNQNSNKTVFVGMSGGVDSSLSAYLLKEQGYNVVGVFIKTWHPDFIECNEEEERRDAMRVAAFLDIPFLTFDFEDVYKKGVADYMINEYKAGRTPNPDVMCNREVKFGAFLNKALSMGADFVATGHYVNVRQENNSFSQVLGSSSPQPDHSKKNNSLVALNYYFFDLLKSIDPTKDQSYFLWTLKQEQLKNILFPIGNLTKKQVRVLAKKYKLPVAFKKDSQGICFLGMVDLKDFLKHYIKEKKGKVLNEKGEKIGEHEGAFFYTLGERKGFKIIKKNPNDKPYYIFAKDIEKNILHVSQNKDYLKENKKDNNFHILENLNFINEIPKENKEYTAQVRYHGEFYKCKLEFIDSKKLKIYFGKEVLVDSGQSVVFYDKDIVLGGGIVV